MHESNQAKASMAIMPLLGCSIPYWVAGDSTRLTFILVHGLGASHHYFKPLAKHLSKVGRVITYDAAGFGDSTTSVTSLTLTSQARILQALIAQQQKGQLVLIGHSMGCQIIADLSSETLASSRVILIGPTIYPKERTALKQVWRLGQNIMHEPWRVNLILTRDYLHSVHCFLPTLKAMLGDCLEVHISHISAPLLLMRGSKDKVVPAQWIDHLQGQALQANKVTVKGAAHAAHFSHAQQVAELCRKFVEQSHT